jgi:hypothetical protein
MNINFVVLSIWNLPTSNSLIQLSPDFNWTTQIVELVITINLLQRSLSPEHLFPLGYVLPRTRTCIFKERLADFTWGVWCHSCEQSNNKIYNWPAFPSQMNGI